MNFFSSFSKGLQVVVNSTYLNYLDNQILIMLECFIIILMASSRGIFSLLGASMIMCSYMDVLFKEVM